MWLGIDDTKVWVYEGQRMIAPQRILAVGNRVYVVCIGVYYTHLSFLKLKVRICRYDHCQYPTRTDRRPPLTPPNPLIPLRTLALRRRHDSPGARTTAADSAVDAA